jgi:poly-gamma-glutamate capsule biosynthesis protein CapA/YwtB (metallophosphatase superfamily)
MKKRMPEPPALSILVASDWAPIRAFDPIMRKEPLAIYGDLLPILHDADLRIVNCECALTSAGQAVIKSGAVFRGEPAHIQGLTAVPFHIACMANNHVLDYGTAGLRRTLDLFEKHGIRAVGAGLTEEAAFAPLSLKTGNNHWIHIVNFSEGEDLTAARGGPGVFGWELPRVVATVRECRRQGGIILAIGHCGLEYVPYPPAYIVRAFREIAEAGADCVIGHHPHVPQGMEWHGGKPIFYSLGNFVFYQETDLLYRKIGFCVTLRFAGGVLAAVEMHPYRIEPHGLCRLEPREERAFRRTVAKISNPFQNRGGYQKAWQAYLAYYGQKGFSAEVAGILETMALDAPKGAAMFRNRITTKQHSELWCDLLSGLMQGKAPSHSPAAYRIVEEYFTRKVAQGAGGAQAAPTASRSGGGRIR